MKFLLLAGALSLAVIALTWLFGPVVLPLALLALLIVGAGRQATRVSRQAWMPAIAGLAVLMLIAPAAAGAATIDFGPIVTNGLADFVGAVVTALLSVALGWVLYVVKNKFNIDIEASNRDALNAFIQRQARSLVADGATKLSGVKIEVSNAALAAAANAGLSAVPDALKYFGLTPDKVQSMIIDALPQVPSVAQAQAVALDVANPATPSKAAA
jgi:hypothetical protein